MSSKNVAVISIAAVVSIALLSSAVSMIYSTNKLSQAVVSLSSPKASSQAESNISSYSASQIGRIAADYLIANPENLVKAGDALQKKSETSSTGGVVSSKAALLDATVTPVIGNENADVAVIEFFDYLCHFCQQVTPVADQSIRSEPNVRYYFKEFPIFASSQPVSGLAAATGLHIYKHYGAEAYHKYHSGLMVTTAVFGKSRRPFTETDLRDLVAKAGFTMNFTNEERTQYEEVIAGNMKLGENLGINGTPAFIVMNLKNPSPETTSTIPGATDLNHLKAAIEKARGSN